MGEPSARWSFRDERYEMRTHAEESDPGLSGSGLLQSQEEWDARGNALVNSLSHLMLGFMPNVTGRCIDVGCQKGELTDRYKQMVGREWVGIDPIVEDAGRSRERCVL